MSPSNNPATPVASRISISIPNVTDATKVSDLTVGQLVELLVQVNPQLPLDKRMPAPEALQAAFTQVRDLITGQSADTRPPAIGSADATGHFGKDAGPDQANRSCSPGRRAGPSRHATGNIGAYEYRPGRELTTMPEFACSRYNILISLRGGRTLAYNAMGGASAVWEEMDAEVFQSIERGEEIDATDNRVAELLYGGFVVRAGTNELEILRRQYYASRNNPSGMVLTIAPTLMCNFGCDYCFQGHNKPRGSMQPDVQDAVFALVARAAPTIKHLHIAWYGGEPLLAPAVIASLSDRVISLCDQRGIAFDAMIVTNGYKLDANTALFVTHPTREGSPDHAGWGCS